MSGNSPASRAQRLTTSLRLPLCRREDRDPVAADRPKPEILPDLNRHSTNTERIVVGVANKLLECHRGGVHLPNVRRLRRACASLARGEQQAVWRQTEVVDAEASRNGVFLDRCLPARQANH